MTRRHHTLRIHNWQWPLKSRGTGSFLHLPYNPKQKRKSTSLSCLMEPNVTLVPFICTFILEDHSLNHHTFQPDWTNANPLPPLSLSSNVYLVIRFPRVSLPDRTLQTFPEKVTFLSQYFTALCTQARVTLQWVAITCSKRFCLCLHQYFPKQVSFYYFKVKLETMVIPFWHTRSQSHSIITVFIKTKEALRSNIRIHCI